MRIGFLLSAAALALTVHLPANAVIYSFSASLSNLGEPVPTSTGTGSALVTFDDAALTIAVHETFATLVNNASAAHIHCCTAVPGTGSSGVLVGFTGFPSAKSGTYDNTFTPTPTTFATVLAGAKAGKAYVNIHSPGTYAGGEIRGFLAPVPEPASLALMFGGLGLVGLAARRRQRG